MLAAASLHHTLQTPNTLVAPVCSLADIVTMHNSQALPHIHTRTCLFLHCRHTCAGGYVEFSVKLPGDAQHSGFWAAAWLMGNLGRAGYYPSLEGMWPFSYDACASGSEPYEWNNYKTQRVSKCNNKKGGYCLVVDETGGALFAQQTAIVSLVERCVTRWWRRAFHMRMGNVSASA